MEIILNLLCDRCNNNQENHISKDSEKNKRVTRVSSAKNNNHIKCSNQNSSTKESTKAKGTSPPRLEKPLIIVDPKDIYCET